MLWIPDLTRNIKNQRPCSAAIQLGHRAPSTLIRSLTALTVAAPPTIVPSESGEESQVSSTPTGFPTPPVYPLEASTERAVRTACFSLAIEAADLEDYATVYFTTGVAAALQKNCERGKVRRRSLNMACDTLTGHVPLRDTVYRVSRSEPDVWLCWISVSLRQFPHHHGNPHHNRFPVPNGLSPTDSANLWLAFEIARRTMGETEEKLRRQDPSGMFN